MASSLQPAHPKRWDGCRCTAAMLAFSISLLFSGLRTGEMRAQESLAEYDDAFQESTPAGECRVELSVGDEIWVVNTRALSVECSDCTGSEKPAVVQWVNGQWTDRSLDDLFAATELNPSVQNVFYVHGNFTDYGWSLRRGCEVYESFFGSDCGHPPIRFVIWSWKTERESIPVKDFVIKCARSIDEGCRLNSVVSRLRTGSPLIVGYSLGAGATLSALSQPELSPMPVRWRVALIAVALDAHFAPLLADNQQIAGRLESLTVFTNELDPALKSSNRIARRRTHAPPVTQYEVLPNLPATGDSFCQFEVCQEVGRHHAISHYRQAPTIVQSIRELVANGAVIDSTIR